MAGNQKGIESQRPCTSGKLTKLLEPIGSKQKMSRNNIQKIYSIKSDDNIYNTLLSRHSGS